MTNVAFGRHRTAAALLCGLAAAGASFGQFGQSEGEHVTTSPTIGGIGAFDVPADCDVAVGVSHVAVVDNYKIHVYTKADFDPTSDPSWAEEHDMRGVSGFFSELFPAPETAPPPFDPRVVFDMYDNRYWIVAMDFVPYDQDTNPVADVFFDIAVSATGDPTGTWYKFRLDADAWADGIIVDSGNLDYTNAAVDEDWLYISAWCLTQLPSVNPPLPLRIESPVWIINKQELMDDEDPPFTQRFQRFFTPNGTPPFQWYNHRATPSPVLNLEASGEPQYFLGVDPGNGGSPEVFYPNNFEHLGLSTVFDEITIHAIVWNGTTPERKDFHLELPAEYRIPKNDTVLQPGVSRGLRLNSARFWATPVLRDGIIYAAHHVRHTSPNDDLHEVRWYKITLNDWPDQLTPGPEIEEGEWGVIAPVSEDGETMYPSVAVNFWGDMLIAYHEAGPHQEPAIRYYLRTWDGEDEANDAIPVDCDGCAIGVFNPSNDQDTIIWGDYSGAEADPTEWCDFWTYNMWAQDDEAGKWRTWLARVTHDYVCAEEMMLDYSRDRSIGLEDVQTFDSLYRQGHRGADFNRDRAVDALDYVAFLSAFARHR